MVMSSCEEKLDIPQKGVLDYSSYYQTDEQADAAANALYYSAERFLLQLCDA